MKRIAVILGVVAVILALPMTAFAASISWTGGSGDGSDLLPCADGGHWVLSQAQSVKSATLVVVGATYEMQPDGKDSFTADSSGPIAVGDLAVATYDGGGDPVLSLTACEGSSSPSPTPTPTPTPSPSPSPSGSPPPSGSPGPSGHSGGGGSGQTGTSGGTPTLHGGPGTATDPSSPVRRLPGHGPHATRGLIVSARGALDPTSSHASDPSSVALGAADGAVQQAWNDGGADPFQVARRAPRALVFAVIAVVAIGVGGAFAARHRLIHGAP
jgi:hypothetical protein